MYGELECMENWSVWSGECMEWGIVWNGGVYRRVECMEWGSVWSVEKNGVGSVGGDRLWSVGM